MGCLGPLSHPPQLRKLTTREASGRWGILGPGSSGTRDLCTVASSRVREHPEAGHQGFLLSCSERLSSLEPEAEAVPGWCDYQPECTPEQGLPGAWPSLLLLSCSLRVPACPFN